MTVQVAVVGGGLAGLFTAGELSARGIDDIVVLDRADHPGGVARTIQRGGYSLEPAAGTFVLPHPHLSTALTRIGASMVPAAGERQRYLFEGERLIPLPLSPKLLLTPIAPPLTRLRAAAEAMTRSDPPPGDESLGDFMRRRFGRGAGSKLAWLAASGVHAGNPDRLSASAAFPMLTGLEAASGSVLRGGLARRKNRPANAPAPTPHTPAGGLAGVVDLAAGALGDRYRAASPVESVRPHRGRWRVGGADTIEAEQVVLACDAQVSGSLLGGDLGATLGAAQRAPVVVIGLGGPATAFPIPDGFGALVAREAGLVSLGILFESSYAPHRAPERHSFVKVIAGGACRPDVATWDDGQLVEVIGHEVSRVIESDVDAEFVQVIRHDGIPQYNTGHGSWLSEIDRGRPPGLHLTGWSYRGIGVANLATDAAGIARTISEAT